MERETLKERKESLTYIYSGMSPSELIEEYDAYVEDKDEGMFYKVLIKEISKRSEGKIYTWIKKIKVNNEFLSQSDNLKLDPAGVFQNIDKKGKLLEDILGYKKLQGDKRLIKTLITLNDERIGRAFQSNYNTAKRQLGFS